MRTSKEAGSKKIFISILLIGIAVVGTKGSETDPAIITLGSFEKTETQEDALANWLIISPNRGHFKVCSDYVRNGRQSLRIEAQGNPNAYQLIVREIPIDDQKKYTFEVYAMNDRENPLKGDIEAQLVVEWKDENGEELGREWTKRWDTSLSRLRWERYELKNRHPPERAVKAIVGVHLFEGKRGGKGALYVDDLTVSVMP